MAGWKGLQDAIAKATYTIVKVLEVIYEENRQEKFEQLN
jgi:hypothetical protein